MQSLIENFTQRLRLSLEKGKEIHPVPVSTEIRNVVVAGLGSAGVAAELVQSLVWEEMAVPMTIIGHEIPAFVNAHTLFITISLSGDSAEVLSAVGKAFAQKATVACITRGGQLAELAQQRNATLAHLSGDTTHEKAFVEDMLTQLLFVLQRYGLISDAFVGQLQAAIEIIGEREHFIREGAENMAAGLHGKLPVLYGDARFLPVLRHFQQQLNENSRQFAHTNAFPEINHAEMRGWKHPEDILRETMVVMLQTGFDQPHTKTHMETAHPLILPQSGGVTEVILRYGNSFLTQAVYAIHLFDWTSFYLAQENKEALGKG